MKYFQFLILGFSLITSCKSSITSEELKDDEQYRPAFHFTPEKMWMNDPNGMVYFDGEYHLFYQHYPDSNVWGPMHWGHAVSTDLMHWEHLPIALYPDSLGYIFSGSAVIDWENTSGLGKGDKPPMVAVYTYHDPIREKDGENTYQTQAIAYSNDNGRSWTKYEGNPVLPNPGIQDFRDPKVIWHKKSGKWIMALAVADHISFYSSPDLKDWSFESDFGKDIGAHGGVWECPDLFPIIENIGEKWILLVSLTNGGPQGGSATQYFIGDFDGSVFTPEDTVTRWIDYGKDNYAGVTWSDGPFDDRSKLFIGWMSNWQYSQVVPTVTWRSAMTLPRTLSLFQFENKKFIRSVPTGDLNSITVGELARKADMTVTETDTVLKYPEGIGSFGLDMKCQSNVDFELVFSNDNEFLKVGFDENENMYYVDRTGLNNQDFSNLFSGIHNAPRLDDRKFFEIEIFVDRSSIEVFFDGGKTVVTDLYFSDNEFTTITVTGNDLLIEEIIAYELQSIWD